MSGFEFDDGYPTSQGSQGQQPPGDRLVNTFGFLGGLAYGLSDKDGLVPKPGEFKKNFDRVCWGYALLVFSPFIIAFVVTLVIMIINALGGDHNAMWQNVCDAFDAEGGWCPDPPLTCAADGWCRDGELR